MDTFYLMPYTLYLTPYALYLTPYALYLSILHKIGHAIIEIVIVMAYGLWFRVYGLWLMRLALPYVLSFMPQHTS